MNKEKLLNLLQGKVSSEPSKTLDLLIKNFENLDLTYGLIEEIMTLPCMSEDLQFKIKFLITVIEGGNIYHDIINILCSVLTEDRNVYNNAEITDYIERLYNVVDRRYDDFEQETLLTLAHAFEKIYAYGVKDYKNMIILIYRRLKTSGYYNSLDYVHIRKKMALAAYGCNEHNYVQMNRKIEKWRNRIKAVKLRSCKGMGFYYSGICQMRYLKDKPNTLEIYDFLELMNKANANKFPLAKIYSKHYNY